MQLHAPYGDPAVDASGAIMWCGPDKTLLTSSGPSGVARELQSVRFAKCTRRFRFGTVIDFDSRQCNMMRFDVEPVADGGAPAQ